MHAVCKGSCNITEMPQCGCHPLDLVFCLSQHGLDVVSGLCMGWQLVHIDIKSPNVLLQDKVWLVAKIADLRISKYLVEDSLLDFTFRGASVCFHAVLQEYLSWSRRDHLSV